MNFKDAAYHTVHDYPGGADALAVRMGKKNGQVLTNKVCTTTDTHHLRLDEAVVMMALTGDHRIMHAIAGELGGVFAQLPTGKVTEANIFAMIMHASAKHGDICQEFHEAMVDGHLSEEEKAVLVDKIQKTITSLYQLKNSLEKNE